MSIQPVIIAAATQKSLVLRLAKYCRELDGTEIHVIDGNEGTKAPYPQCNSLALHQAALLYKDKPFIWLEPDSIPLKPGWVKAISEEYQRLGKPFMLSSDSHPPGDLVGGIGVYGSDCHKIIPREVEFGAWDGWMIKNIKDQISFTPLIQHKYGIYDSNGIYKTREISFPRDRDLLRSNAVIFHKDSGQTLIPRKPGPLRFLHSGCIGDAIAALPSIRQLGGGDLIMTQINNSRILRGERYESIRPLLESQSYIRSVTWREDSSDIDHDFTDFRKIYNYRKCIAEMQSQWIGIDKLNLEPWLKVDPDPRGIGRVIIARSPRYHNPSFPWRKFLKVHGQQILFVGLKEEHDIFQKEHGKFVEHVETKNMLEIAQIIAGCLLFAGNQSSPFWVAAGLGVKIMQETCMENPDSIILRNNIRYWVNGRQSLAF